MLQGLACKMERRGRCFQHHAAPNHSEPIREVRAMADGSQYTDSSLCGNAERSGNGVPE